MENVLQLTGFVDFPTRGQNTMDQIFVNFSFDHKATALPPIGRSDHCALWWALQSSPRLISVKRKVRKFTKANVARFHHEVSHIN